MFHWAWPRAGPDRVAMRHRYLTLLASNCVWQTPVVRHPGISLLGLGRRISHVNNKKVLESKYKCCKYCAFYSKKKNSQAQGVATVRMTLSYMPLFKPLNTGAITLFIENSCCSPIMMHSGTCIARQRYQHGTRAGFYIYNNSLSLYDSNRAKLIMSQMHLDVDMGF